MAKYITRRNPDSIVTVKVYDAEKDTVVQRTVTIRDLPAVGKNPARRKRAVEKAVKPSMLLAVVSVAEAEGFYRMPQETFLKAAEFVTNIDDEDEDEE